jgi:hypothetical protein
MQIYGLLRSGQINYALDKLVKAQSMDGITLYIGLARLQPDSAEVFDWTDTDRVFAAAKAHDKKVTLVLIGGRWIPQWIYDTGAKPIDWMHETTRVEAGRKMQKAPVPWDPIYLAAMRRAIEALADRYATHPCLTRVQITGPALSNGLEANFNLKPDHAKQVGFEYGKYAQAWDRMTQVTMDAFPKQELAWAIHNQFPTSSGRNNDFASSLRDRLAKRVGDRFVVMHCYLTHEPWYTPSNDAVELWTGSAPTSRLGAQLIDIYSSKHLTPENMVEACRRARDLGAIYVEIFASDLIKSEFDQALVSFKRGDD